MWASIWEKKRYRASAEARAFFTALRSAHATTSCGEYWRRTRSMAHWALNRSTQAALSSALRRATSNCLLPDCIYGTPCDWGITQAGSEVRMGGLPILRTCGTRLRGQLFYDVVKLYIVSFTPCKLTNSI